MLTSQTLPLAFFMAAVSAIAFAMTCSIATHLGARSTLLC
jgi:hypothetical protein